MSDRYDTDLVIAEDEAPAVSPRISKWRREADATIAELWDRELNRPLLESQERYGRDLIKAADRYLNVPWDPLK